MASLGQIHKVSLSAVGRMIWNKYLRLETSPVEEEAKPSQGLCLLDPVCLLSWEPRVASTVVNSMEEPAFTKLSLSLCIVGQQVWVNSKILRLWNRRLSIEQNHDINWWLITNYNILETQM